MTLSKINGMTVKELTDTVNLLIDNVNTIAGTNGTKSITGATATLTLDDNGKTITFGATAGCVVTLPAAKAGLRFKFIVGVSNTSGANKVIAAASTSLFKGGILMHGSTTDAGFVPGASDYAISMNGTTTGGLIGTQFDLVCVSATEWVISGVVFGSGTLATPFAAA